MTLDDRRLFNAQNINLVYSGLQIHNNTLTEDLIGSLLFLVDIGGKAQ